MTAQEMAELIDCLVSTHGAACIEELTCPDCKYATHYLHPFIERVLCCKCERPIVSNLPRKPGPGEPIALDYEEALQELAATDVNTALYIRDLATSLACDRV